MIDDDDETTMTTAINIDNDDDDAEVQHSVMSRSLNGSRTSAWPNQSFQTWIYIPIPYVYKCRVTQTNEPVITLASSSDPMQAAPASTFRRPAHKNEAPTRRKLTPETDAGNGHRNGRPKRTPKTDAGNGRRKLTPEADAGNGRRKLTPETDAGNWRRKRTPEADAGNGRRKRTPETDAGNGRWNRTPETDARNGRRKWTLETGARNGRRKRTPEASPPFGLTFTSFIWSIIKVEWNAKWKRIGCYRTYATYSHPIRRSIHTHMHLTNHRLSVTLIHFDDKY